MRVIYCRYCDKDITFFMPASWHAHARDHNDEVMWDRGNGYYIGWPRGAAPIHRGPVDPPTVNEEIDLHALSDEQWDVAFRKLMSPFVR